MKQLFSQIRMVSPGFQPSWMKEAFMGLFTTRMSVVAFHLDYAVFPPVVLLSLWRSLQRVDALAVVALFFAGLAAWTLAEYLLHRFALHHWPYFSAHHLAHHEEPRAMIAAPTLFTLGFFASAFLLPLWLITGEGPACGLFAGFITGYLAFALVHQACHHSNWQGQLMRHFRLQHALHHHGQAGKNFGVLTQFWDRVFGTCATVKPRKP